MSDAVNDAIGEYIASLRARDMYYDAAKLIHEPTQEHVSMAADVREIRQAAALPGLPVVNIALTDLWPLTPNDLHRETQAKVKASIEQHGLRLPLVVAPATAEDFREHRRPGHRAAPTHPVLAVVVGNNRYWACWELGWSKTVPVAIARDIPHARTFGEASRRFGWPES